jgi:pimeloyl-ACP methyl ester carboxylesterase
VTDAQIRAAEFRAYREVGGEPRDRILRLHDGTQALDVRITELGEPGDQPPVLVQHGIASASVMLAPLLPHLAGRRVVVVDWPGHGLSGSVRVEPGAGVRRHVRGVHSSLLEAIDAEQVDVVGHSLGAQFGLYAALDHPDRVRRLVTLGAPGAGLDGTRPIPIMRALSLPGIGPLLLKVPMSDRQFRQSGAMALGPGVMEAQSPLVYDAAKRVAGRGANAAGTASMFHALLHRGRVRDGVVIEAGELGSLTVPVLMVWGDRDVFLTPSAAQPSIDAIPDARLMQVDAGHGPWLEHPVEVGRAVGEFLG